MIVEEIRDRMTAVPFVPFSVLMADGREYPVPTADHVWITPTRWSLFIAKDNGGTAMLPVAHVTALTAQESDSQFSSAS